MVEEKESVGNVSEENVKAIPYNLFGVIVISVCNQS